LIAEDFLPRALYGDYLQDSLLQAERSAPPHVRLTRVFGDVRDIERREGGKPLLAVTADGGAIPADRIILALLPWAEEVRNHPAYVHDPWKLPQTLGAAHAVLIVGNGLTMADVASALSRDPDHTPRITTVSRHGLTPETQTAFRPSAVQGDGASLLACATSIREVLSAGRALTREVIRLGGDWREVVTFIRTLAPQIWARLPVDAVINATGPDYALSRSTDPLVVSLLGTGMVTPDALNLGLRTVAHGACVAADGRAGTALYYLGPLLRAAHWEATAAAELRNHAEDLARHLVSGD
jgi:uncharacterized NAD(P)/FAD-binding protein YdhS